MYTGHGGVKQWVKHGMGKKHSDMRSLSMRWHLARMMTGVDCYATQ